MRMLIEIAWITTTQRI